MASTNLLRSEGVAILYEVVEVICMYIGFMG